MMKQGNGDTKYREINFIPYKYKENEKNKKQLTHSFWIKMIQQLVIIIIFNYLQCFM